LSRELPDIRDDFVGRDQRIMQAAGNYLRFQFELVAPYLNGDVLEIGAGIGNMTTLAVGQAERMTSLTCIEMDPQCHDHLKALDFPAGLNVEIFNGRFPEVFPENRCFDLIYHFNVLEHIENDLEALDVCYRLLKPGGIHFMFVPAFPVLFGSMDRQLRHYRRYTRKALADLLEQCGYRIRQARYCNATGFLGWFVNNRIFNIREQKSGQVRFFDTYVLPVQNRLEKKFDIPFGQNLYVVAEKPDTIREHR
jgi:SAM-dependent methyltransferase